MFAARRTRHLIATATLCLLLAVPWTTRAGPIIYSIQNYPPEQNGHTLSGTITTDGQIGPLAGSDITSWSVTFDDTSTFTGSGVLLQGVVQATSTSITLPAAPSNSVANLLFLVSPAGDLEWERPAGSTSGIYAASHEPLLQLWNTKPATLGGTDPWVLAAVPEPSSLWMAVSGISAGLAYGWFRCRRVLRRREREAG
jgi:hypothetical protein